MNNKNLLNRRPGCPRLTFAFGFSLKDCIKSGNFLHLFIITAYNLLSPSVVIAEFATPHSGDRAPEINKYSLQINQPFLINEKWPLFNQSNLSSIDSPISYLQAQKINKKNSDSTLLIIWKALIPNHATTYVAGYSGALAMGVGWQLGQKHELTYLLGYAPSRLGAAIDLWQSSIKYRWYILKPYALGKFHKTLIRLRPVFVGLGVIYGHSDSLFIKNPDQYPEDFYYHPTKIRGLLSMGFGVHIGKHWDVYGEYNFIETGIEPYIRNFDFFRRNYAFWGLAGVGSLGAGFNYKF